MKVGAIFGASQAGIVNKPDPKPKYEFTLVKVHTAPLCTEYKGFNQEGKSDSLGHEAAGEVVEIAQPGRVKMGDRVVVMPQYSCGKCPLCLKGDYIHCEHNLDVNAITGNTYCTATVAQFLVKQDWLLLPIPASMSYEHASMACCGLGPTFNAMQMMNVNAFDTVLITGMGPVGLGGVINGVFRGARVLGIESHPYRIKLAKELGAEQIIDPTDKDALKKVMDLTGGLGVDKSIDTSGVPEAKSFLIQAARRKGQVAFVGWSGQIDVNTIIGKGLTIHGAWHWNLTDTPLMMKLIGKSEALLDKMITHTFPMSRIQEAFELQLTGNCGKVILYPWK